ncbi:hypothetical protein VP01_2744g1 [Puccinia sorghi]|uniref:MULE transposase domain-containing protein n=1 Tax=Puccinia sorghi TaxID=27349 RepID=A0A0L6V326_9BASI|nr:hypothetical protein VP01_2744g1 [Puccinia sorghi]
MCIKTPKHYLCFFHILKAFNAQSKIFLGKQSIAAITGFQILLYRKEDRTIPFIQYWHGWLQVSQGFAKYIRKQWPGRMLHWAITFLPQNTIGSMKWLLYFQSRLNLNVSGLKTKSRKGYGGVDEKRLSGKPRKICLPAQLVGRKW